MPQVTRCGVLARKVGMTRVFDDDGRHVPVTVLRLDGCQVTGVRTEASDGYVALQVGAGKAKVKNVPKPMRGHFAKARVEPKMTLCEFRISADAALEPGDEITADHFVSGQFVDVTGTSIGKGFAGAMKRHNFAGLRASHGVSISHRAHGSTGQCQDPGRVFKGKRMAGHMGAERVTVQNLQVVSADADSGVILVRGAVPGAKGGWVMVRDAIKHALPEAAPKPGAVRKVAYEAPVEPVEETAETAEEAVVPTTEAVEAAQVAEPTPPPAETTAEPVDAPAAAEPEVTPAEAASTETAPTDDAPAAAPAEQAAPAVEPPPADPEKKD